jgi:hypothetical protein
MSVEGDANMMKCVHLMLQLSRELVTLPPPTVSRLKSRHNASPSEFVFSSAWILSHTFFFGFNWAISPSALKPCTKIESPTLASAGTANGSVLDSLKFGENPLTEADYCCKRTTHLDAARTSPSLSTPRSFDAFMLVSTTTSRVSSSSSL